MDAITLSHTNSFKETTTATFLPDKGMNLISFKKNGIEVIDQSTKDLFDERYAGLGALIGPHFHRRKPEILPLIKDESLFPHISRVKAKGVHDPFSHGIARYAPWQAIATSTKITANISGKDVWNGLPLSALEGQNFKMALTAELTSEGLGLNLSVVSDTTSLVGIHYYYHLPNGQGTVVSRIQKTYMEDNLRKTIQDSWPVNTEHTLRYHITGKSESVDQTFYPFPNVLEGKILLDTESHQLHTTYWCDSQENSWQLYHPANASYVCIEPISSQDPRHPNLTVSSLRIQLQILTGAQRHAF